MDRSRYCGGFFGSEAILVGFIIAALLGCLFAVFLAHKHEEQVEMPKAYQAWIKQTGNEKGLTFQEWRSLLRANEKQNDSTLIFIPVSQ